MLRQVTARWSGLGLLLVGLLALEARGDAVKVKLTGAGNEVLVDCGLQETRWGRVAVQNVPLIVVTPELACPDPSSNQTHIQNGDQLAGNVALVKRGNCTFSDKVLALTPYAPAAILIVSTPDSDVTLPVAAQDTDYDGVNCSVIMVSDRLDVAPNRSTWLRVHVDPQHQGKLDGSAFVFLLMAIFVLVSASLWSSHADRVKWLYQPLVNQTDEAETMAEEAKEDDVVVFTWRFILYLVYLVYVIMIFFVIGSTSASSALLRAWWPWSTGSTQQSILCTKWGFVLTVYDCLTALPGLCMGVTWFCIRHEPNAWVLQDILGMCLLINALNVLRVATYQSICLLLTIFPIYDVFFVFITPLITKSHDSVMVKAATGGSGSTERMPLVLTLPRFESDYCYRGLGVLGFGDILLPGLAVVYAINWDCLRLKYRGVVPSSRGLGALRHLHYFWTALAAYITGLGLTFAAMAAMNTAQPALLYLGPSMLVALTLCGHVHGELGYFWRGGFHGPSADDDESKSGLDRDTDSDSDSTLLDLDQASEN
ncbi:uncharacterized protein MONBRDRAFT_32222 [Monosiga brevicollis MX1]|uniref:PA domain-containing protein n=1 Tax=Monosiga brevicollis TaxID=81824 RepID=A9UXJ3_MONBE|nr:uncharacterized protein MONBRDRAFT_32222 [Monosiga brevicollis MX1]EDQ89852.1 predicted protein [Monosiga brevicollis MX1]|eukprot:XP_001745274.1 hypothetical protein [Monosiga brevicollis MX1]